MAPAPRPLSMYGQPAQAAPLGWPWVEDQLSRAGTYWVQAPGPAVPHPRPVWGLWTDERLHLSVGSPLLADLLIPGCPVTVHLDSGTDVVIIEGAVSGTSVEPSLLRSYDAKYDWAYRPEEYGPLTTITPHRVLAWRSAGWAGRDGFQEAGAWAFGSAETA